MNEQEAKKMIEKIWRCAPEAWETFTDWRELIIDTIPPEGGRQWEVVVGTESIGFVILRDSCEEALARFHEWARAKGLESAAQS